MQTVQQRRYGETQTRVWKAVAREPLDGRTDKITDFAQVSIALIKIQSVSCSEKSARGVRRIGQHAGAGRDA